MALNSRGSIDPRWMAHNARVGLGSHLATIEIYNQNTLDKVYDPTTNTWSGDSTTLWTGQARIQPINVANQYESAENPTVIKTVRVQIAFNKNTLTGATEAMADIRPGDKMIVTSSPFNAQLDKFLYTVLDVMNSSNAWERTFTCKVDTELDPTVTE